MEIAKVGKYLNDFAIDTNPRIQYMARQKLKDLENEEIK